MHEPAREFWRFFSKWKEHNEEHNTTCAVVQMVYLLHKVVHKRESSKASDGMGKAKSIVELPLNHHRFRGVSNN